MKVVETAFKTVKLGTVVKIKTGKLDANANDPNGEFPFFTCAVEPLKISSYSYECECVLVAGNGDLNVKYYDGKFDAYQRTYIIESIDSRILDVRYLFYFMLSYVEKLRTQSIGGVIKYIKLNNLTDPEIPLPSLEEQKRIAKVLDKADCLRQKDRQLLAHYDQLLQSVFLDMFGDPVKNEKGWMVAHLETVASISSGVTKGRNLEGKETIEVPYMRVANVQDGHLNLTEIKTIEVKTEEADKYLLKYGDVLLTEGGDPDKLGRGTVWRNEIPNCIHQNHIFKVRADISILDPTYLSAHLGSTYGKRYFLKSSKQTTGIASINSSQLKKFPVQIPPLELQQHYASIVTKLDKQKKFVSKGIKASETLFQSLLQKAFKGELQLKDDRVVEEVSTKPKFIISSIL